MGLLSPPWGAGAAHVYCSFGSSSLLAIQGVSTRLVSLRLLCSSICGEHRGHNPP